MKEVYENLNQLLADVSIAGSLSDNNKLSSCFSKYKSLLDKVSGVSSYYNTALGGHFTELTNIGSEISIAKSVKSEKERRFFKYAVSHLKDDLEEFMKIVKNQEKIL